MAGKTISQRITLEGTDEIARQLAQLAEASAAVFKQIQDAAKNTDIKLDPATRKSFDELAASGAKLVEQFAGLTQAASESAPEVEKVGEAAATAGEGFNKLGEAASQTAEAIGKIDDASQQTASNIAKSGDAAEKSSKGYTELGLSVVRTGAAVAGAAGSLAQAGAATAGVAAQTVTAAASVGTFALVLGSTLVSAIGAAAGALVLLGGWLERIATSDAKLSIMLDHLALSTQGIGQSFSRLQVGQAAFEQIGVSAEKFRTVIGNLAREVASFDVGKAIAASSDKIDAATKKALEAQKALIELRIQAEATDIRAPRVSLEDRQQLLAITEQLKQKTLDLGQAETANAAAQQEKAKAQQNNLKTIIELMKQIESGAKVPLPSLFDLADTETKLAAMKATLQDVAKAGGDVSQAFLKIIANLPRADAFAIGKAIGLSETDVDRVRRYGAEATKIPGLFEKIRAAGVLISAQDAEAFDALAESTQRVESAGARLRQAWDSTFFSRIGAAATTVFNNMTASVVEFAALTLESFNMLGGQLFTTVGQIFQGLGILLSQAGTGLAAAFMAGLSLIGQGIATIFGQVGSFIQQWVTTPVGNAWQWIVDTFNSAVTGLTTAMAAAYQSVISFVTTPVAGAWAWIVEQWNALVASLGFGGGSSAAQTGGGGSGFAGGGLLGGRGTGTSDSNLAWVSRGEYIVPARAVAMPGVLALLERLRLGAGDLRGLLGGFAAGGLVMPRISVPAFAGGGMNNVTIQFPGLPEITGLRASSGVVDELRRAAAMAQVRNGGRKPSRYS